MSVLVVDDVAYMRSIIRQILVNDCGFVNDHIIEAANGTEAIKMYKSEKPELVFCDILMPDVTGIDVVRELMTIDPDAKIIMCTSSSEIENVKICTGLGAKDYIIKPPKPERIRQAVEKVLGKILYRPSAQPTTISSHPINDTWQQEIESLRKDVDFLLKEIEELKGAQRG